jgi:aminopeptidase N
MAGRTTERLHPEWQTALDNVPERNGAIERDALATTHPVVQHVATVEEAHSAFDEITYSKGAAVIRMLENYVGEDAWRDGVRSYIKANAYGNAVSDQLWTHVERAAHKPVTAIAHDFTLQPGVPLIKVEAAACQGGKTRVTLTQGEYSKDHADKQPLSWRVPVLAQTVGAKEASRVLVSGGKASITLPGCGAVLVNAGQAGYYRTQYAPPAYAELAASFAKRPARPDDGQLGAGPVRPPARVRCPGVGRPHASRRRAASVGQGTAGVQGPAFLHARRSRAQPEVRRLRHPAPAAGDAAHRLERSPGRSGAGGHPA